MLSLFGVLQVQPEARDPVDAASISDYDAILPAFQGIDTVVHMARDADFGIAHMSGTVHVLEACRACGVKLRRR